MAFNVTQFRSNIKFDGARPNLFEVSLSFPSIVPNGETSGQQALFLAKTAQLPGSSIGTVSLNYFGRELKFAGNRTFTDWTITIINDEDFGIRNSLETWMNTINSHTSNVRAPGAVSPLGYTTNSLVTQFGKDGSTIIKKYNFVGMFPVDISPIDLDWGNNDQIEEYSVTFAYQYWEDVAVGGTTGTTN
jgi:T4-like virus tail tube protein gp19